MEKPAQVLIFPYFPIYLDHSLTDLPVIVCHLDDTMNDNLATLSGYLDLFYPIA
jgi:hypothetical protein